jgi:hypothetical protein
MTLSDSHDLTADVRKIHKEHAVLNIPIQCHAMLCTAHTLHENCTNHLSAKLHHRSASIFFTLFQYPSSTSFCSSSLANHLKSLKPSLLSFKLTCPAMMRALRKNVLAPLSVRPVGARTPLVYSSWWWPTGTWPTSQVFMLGPPDWDRMRDAACGVG